MQANDLKRWEQENHILSYDLSQRDAERGWNEPSYNFDCGFQNRLPITYAEYNTLLSILIQIAQKCPTKEILDGYFSIQSQGIFYNHFTPLKELQSIECILFHLSPSENFDYNGEIKSIDEVLPLIEKIARRFPTDASFERLYEALEKLKEMNR